MSGLCHFNYCDQISDRGLEYLSGLSNLTSTSFKKSNAMTAEGMKAFRYLVNLVNLDLERCLKIHGSLIYIEGLKKLETLNIRCCNCIRDVDIISLSGLRNLRELQMSSCKVSNVGISHLKGLKKLVHLNLEGCPVIGPSLEFISGLASLLYLNLSRCCLYDEGCRFFAYEQSYVRRFLAMVDEGMRVEKVEFFYAPSQLLSGFLKGKLTESSVSTAPAACPFLSA